MSEVKPAPAARLAPGDMQAGRLRYNPAQRRHFVLITLGAAAIFLGLRALPTGTNLNHMDFRVDAKDAIEFCDPSNPQFIPVVAVRSPVVMKIATPGAAAIGSEIQAVVSLHTAGGKPLAPADLLVAHTRKLHLMLVDPTLTDYQHVHPEPAKRAGEWTFAFTPRAGGTYRVFADFTPAATGRGLYASVDLEVAAESAGAASRMHAPAQASAEPDLPRTAAAGQGRPYTFALEPLGGVLRAGQPADLRFTVTRADGGAVPLEPIMGAFAHLVAFDETRSGFAHLHPAEVDLEVPPDRQRPVLNFKLTIPKAGRYVIWAQTNIGGHEEFVPFWFEVT